jgi:hypothetical protein
VKAIDEQCFYVEETKHLKAESKDKYFFIPFGRAELWDFDDNGYCNLYFGESKENENLVIRFKLA